MSVFDWIAGGWLLFLTYRMAVLAKWCDLLTKGEARAAANKRIDEHMESLSKEQP